MIDITKLIFSFCFYILVFGAMGRILHATELGRDGKVVFWMIVQNLSITAGTYFFMAGFGG